MVNRDKIDIMNNIRGNVGFVIKKRAELCVLLSFSLDKIH